MGRCRLGERAYVVTPFCVCEPEGEEVSVEKRSFRMDGLGSRVEGAGISQRSYLGCPNRPRNYFAKTCQRPSNNERSKRAIHSILGIGTVAGAQGSGDLHPQSWSDTHLEDDWRIYVLPEGGGEVEVVLESTSAGTAKMKMEEGSLKLPRFPNAV